MPNDIEDSLTQKRKEQFELFFQENEVKNIKIEEKVKEKNIEDLEYRQILESEKKQKRGHRIVKNIFIAIVLIIISFILMVIIQVKKEKQNREEAIKFAYKYYKHLYLKEYNNAAKLINNKNINITQYIEEQKKYEKEYGVLKNSLLFNINIMQDNRDAEYRINYYYLTFELVYEDSLMTETLIMRKNKNTDQYSIYKVLKDGKIEKGNLEKYLHK